jgi:hypothetical protein
VATFLAGGLASYLLVHLGPDQADQVLAGVRRLVLDGWEPPDPDNPPDTYDAD